MRAYHLDGLRGWASLVVVINHIYPNFLYGQVRMESITELLSHPAAQIQYLKQIATAAGSAAYLLVSDGALAVKVFFVLSGYVLSVGFLRKRDRSLIADQALRRYLRLTIPIAGCAVLAHCLMKFGLMYNRPFGAMIGSDWIAQFYDFPTSLMRVARFSLLDVYCCHDLHNTYNLALWTMGTELYGSFLVFAVLLIPNRVRLVAYPVVAIATAWIDPNLLAFVFGVAFAEFEPTLPQSIKASAALTMAGAIFVAPLLITKLGRQLASFAEIGVAGAVVVLVELSPPVQRFMRNPVSRFFGLISFPLYLTHPIVLCSVASLFGIAVVPLTGSAGLPLTSIFAISASLATAVLFLPCERIAIRVSQLFSEAVRTSIWTTYLRRFETRKAGGTDRERSVPVGKGSSR
jgi:peptidoglycan/LPS O-acetylase OafA/YrhL